MSLGDLELISVSDGFFSLDGGAMFGVVPRTMWESRLPPDDRNRIPLGMRPLIVRGDETMIIDAGCGDKMDAKSADIYGLDRDLPPRSRAGRSRATVEDIDIVVASHLHFDHVGGFTACTAIRPPGAALSAGALCRPSQEWDDATHPHERNRASYLPRTSFPCRRPACSRWSTTAPRSCPACATAGAVATPRTTRW